MTTTNTTTHASLCLAALIFAGCAPQAHASPLTNRSSEFNVATQDGSHFVLPGNISASLSRNENLPPPNCESVARALAPLERRIEACQENPGTSRCNRLRLLVDEFGKALSVSGKFSLTQTWKIAAPSPLIEESWQTRSFLSSLGLSPADAIYPDAVSFSALPSQLSVVADPHSEWKPVVDLMGYSQEDFSFHLDYGAFSSHNHVLGCALLSGEVEVLWTQDVSYQKSGTTSFVFDAASLNGAYQFLQALSVDLSLNEPLTQAYLGAAVGSVVGVDEHFSAYVGELGALLFDPSTGALLDLTSQEIDQLVQTPDAEVLLNSNWSGRYQTLS